MIAHAKTIRAYWTAKRTLADATAGEQAAFDIDSIKERARLFHGYNPKIIDSDMFRMVVGYLATLNNKSYFLIISSTGEVLRIRLTPKHMQE